MTMTINEIERRMKAFDQAIRRGVNGATRLGVDRAHPVTDEEVDGIATFLELLRVLLDEEVGADEETQLRFLEAAGERIASSALLSKLLAAWEIEWQVSNDGPPAGGVVGRAVDEAVEVLKAYQRR